MPFAAVPSDRLAVFGLSGTPRLPRTKTAALARTIDRRVRGDLGLTQASGHTYSNVANTRRKGDYLAREMYTREAIGSRMAAGGQQDQDVGERRVPGSGSREFGQPLSCQCGGSTDDKTRRGSQAAPGLVASVPPNQLAIMGMSPQNWSPPRLSVAEDKPAVPPRGGAQLIQAIT
jgi:hypothetical protein